MPKIFLTFNKNKTWDGVEVYLLVTGIYLMIVMSEKFDIICAKFTETISEICF